MDLDLREGTGLRDHADGSGKYFDPADAAQPACARGAVAEMACGVLCCDGRGFVVCASATAGQFPDGGHMAGGHRSDPMMLALVWDSPLGTSIGLRLIGLGFILLILVPGRAGRGLAALGACIVALSFVLRGHALEEPRLILGALITLHILGVAFWIGAFVPLYRVAGGTNQRIAGTIAHEFGNNALWVVGLLTGVGAITLWILTGNIFKALYTPYGQFFALKLTIFSAVMGFAAWNKLRLTPALLNQDQSACTKLRQSVRLEATLIGAILITTAALTTVSAPEKSDQIETASAFLTPNRRIPTD